MRKHFFSRYWGPNESSNNYYFEPYGVHNHGGRRSRIKNGYRGGHYSGAGMDAEFMRLHQISRYSGPLIVIFYIVVLYFLFSWAGFKTIAILLAVLLAAKGIFHLYYFNRLEKQVFQPVAALEQGFQDIAAGNYQVHLDHNVSNQFGRLIGSFNEMAEKLRVSEQVNQSYEENRKALIANISHDLKTPITAVQGYVEMILNGDVQEPQQVQKYLKIIQNNNTYINKLIDDLFLFSKLDMDKMEFKLEPVQVKPFMQDLMSEFVLELEEMKTELRYTDCLELDEQIVIDGKRVYQAVRNVIGNAVRYGPEEGLRIDARLYEQGNYLCLDLQDNGTGIDADKIDFIFERFYRVDSERGKNFNGTGLGLAIAKELLEAQQGKITVASIKNEGSCFTLWFHRCQTAKGRVVNEKNSYH